MTKASIRIKLVGIVLLSIFLITAVLGYLVFSFSKARLIYMLGESSKGIAATAANFVTKDDLILIRKNVDGIIQRNFPNAAFAPSHMYETAATSAQNNAREQTLQNATEKYMAYITLLSNVQSSNKIDSPINVYIKEGRRLILILSSDITTLIGAQYQTRPEADLAIDTRKPQTTGIYEDKDGIWISAYAPILQPPSSKIEAVLEINNKIDIYIRRLKQELAMIIVVCLIGFLATAVISYVLVNRIASKIEKLNEMAHRLQNENYDIRIDIDSRDEIGHLADTFEKMRLSIKKKIEELRSSLAKEKRAHFESIIALTNAIEVRDPYTRQHLNRVDKYALLIAKSIGLSHTETTRLRYGCYLHDIGKIYIDDALFRKELLSKSELESIRQHAEKGAQIVDGIAFFEDVKDIILYHQERFDGKGYPKGLKGTEIPLLARIVALADAFDAMTTDRPYKSKVSFEKAMQILENDHGAQFDPEIVKAFLKYKNEIEQIARKHF